MVAKIIPPTLGKLLLAIRAQPIATPTWGIRPTPINYDQVLTLNDIFLAKDFPYYIKYTNYPH